MHHSNASAADSGAADSSAADSSAADSSAKSAAADSSANPAADGRAYPQRHHTSADPCAHRAAAGGAGSHCG